MDTQQNKQDLGPFTDETFSQGFWDNILSKVHLLEAFPKQKVILEYQHFLQLLQEINSSPDYNHYFGATCIKEYFLTTFLLAATRSLVNCKFSLVKDLRQLVNQCLNELFDISLKALQEEDLNEPIKMLALILDPTQPYYHSSKVAIHPKRDMKMANNQDVKKKVYAVARAFPYSSSQAVDLVNVFGDKGSFELIVERISDKQNPLPISRVGMLCSLIAHISPILHATFLKEYTPKLQEAVFANLFSDLKVDSNKSVLSDLIKTFSVIFARVHPIDKEKIMSRFKLKIIERYFIDPSLEGRLQGVELLGEVVRGAPFIDFSKELSKYLTENNFFDKIFGSEIHVRVIDKSGSHLEYLLNTDTLTFDELEILWNKMADENKDIKAALENLVSRYAPSFQGKHVKFILSKLNKIPTTNINEKHINLVTTFLRTPQKSDFPSKEYWEFYWRIAPANKKTSRSHVSTNGPTFGQLQRHISENAHELRNEVFSVIDECLANIENRTSVLSSYEEIKALINIFKERSQYPEKMTRSKCISYLCKERCLIHRVINELKWLKEDVQKNILNTTEVAENILDSLVDSKKFYMLHINQRLNFIYDILRNTRDGNDILTSDLLGNLLDLTINNGLIPDERRLGLELFEKISLLNSEHFISKDELLQFFHEKVTNKKFISANQLDHFVLAELFKIWFIMVNKRLAHIIELEPLLNAHSSLIYQKLKEQQETDYCLKVSPDQLEGIKDLWELAIDNMWHSTLGRLLIKLYMHPNVISNRQSFQSICFAKIKQALESIEKKQSKTRIIRVLSLVNDAAKESEIEGFANLKSHLGLTKGETLALDIHFTNIHQHTFSKIEPSLDSNMSVFDLRLEIAKNFGIAWNEFEILKLTAPSVVISHQENVNTLSEVGLLARHHLFVKETALPVYRQEALFEKDDTLNPKLEKIFVEWFKEFSDNNQMSQEHCSTYVFAFDVLRQIYRPHDIKYIFLNYDYDRNSYLSQEEFIKFISAYCKDYYLTVWNQLESRQYRRDFKKVNSLGQIQINIKSLPRYLLSINNEQFQLLYSLLDSEDEEIATHAWDLISTLPTNVQILEDIVMLKGVRNTPLSEAKQNMGILFNSKSLYKLLYSLHTAVILIQNSFNDTKNSDKEEFIKEFLWSQNHNLQEHWQSWQADFLDHDGLTHLIEILKVLSTNNSKLQTTIKCLILKIIANYLPVKSISSATDINRIPSLKRLLTLLSNFGQDFIKGKEMLPSRELYLATLHTSKKWHSLPIDKEQQASALDLLSRISFRDLVEETIKLSSPLLAKMDENFDTENLAIANYSISVLRSAVLYIEVNEM